MQTEPFQEINSVSDLPKISSFLLPEDFELLPNISEVFKLEFTFYEYKFLTQDEIIRIGAFFKRFEEYHDGHIFSNCSKYF